MKYKEKGLLALLIGGVILVVLLLLSLFVGEIALITCGALHLARGTFNISDGGAIAMIVVGAFFLVGSGGGTVSTTAATITNN